MVSHKAPKKGDIITLQFSPTEGHEQDGRRPALVLSVEEFNRRTPFLLISPITSKVKGYDFEVPLPKSMRTHGVVLSEQVRTIDWKARKIKIVDSAPESVVRRCDRNRELICGEG